MVEVSSRIAQPVTGITASVPGQKRKERLARIAAAHTIETVRVTPTSDDVRRLVKHPKGGGFRADGSAEWPNDSFTARRVRDGDVTIEE